ncbi:MAG: amidophosphoribosyltransferase, partial [Pseudomonadota bacterium]
DSLFQIQGGYALVMLTNKKLIGVRDPYGIRPLVLGKLKKSYVLASETCALDIIGATFVREIENGEIVIITNATFVREIENGEIVIITNDGVESIKPFPKMKARPCIFEYIYFARPDSLMSGKSVYEFRKNFGEQLAKESHVDADIVSAVPDSGVPAAIGYSRESKIPFELGLITTN